MKKAFAIGAMLTLSGVVSAQDQAPTPSSASEEMKAGPRVDLGEAAAGEVIYMRYCAACHGRSLTGDGPVAPGLVKKPTDLTDLTSKNGGVFPFDKVAASIDGRETTRMHGTPDMPVWGEVFALTTGTGAPNTAEAVKRITHYVWSRQTKTPAKSSK